MIKINFIILVFKQNTNIIETSLKSFKIKKAYEMVISSKDFFFLRDMIKWVSNKPNGETVTPNKVEYNVIIMA